MPHAGHNPLDALDSLTDQELWGAEVRPPSSNESNVSIITTRPGGYNTQSRLPPRRRAQTVVVPASPSQSRTGTRSDAGWGGSRGADSFDANDGLLVPRLGPLIEWTDEAQSVAEPPRGHHNAWLHRHTRKGSDSRNTESSERPDEVEDGGSDDGRLLPLVKPLSWRRKQDTNKTRSTRPAAELGLTMDTHSQSPSSADAPTTPSSLPEESMAEISSLPAPPNKNGVGTMSLSSGTEGRGS
jgi:hypothetical protein